MGLRVPGRGAPPAPCRPSQPWYFRGLPHGSRALRAPSGHLAWTCRCHSLLICPNLRGEGQMLSVLSAPTAQGQLLILQHTLPWRLPEAQIPVCPFVSIFPGRTLQSPSASSSVCTEDGTERNTCMRALGRSRSASSSLKPEGAGACPPAPAWAGGAEAWPSLRN